MINVKIIKKESEIEIYSRGHAEYAEHGKDIICSAVSALIINTVNSIEELTNSKIKIISSVEGDLKVNVLDKTDEAELLIKSLILGLKSIRDEYENKYIDIAYTEV